MGNMSINKNNFIDAVNYLKEAIDLEMYITGDNVPLDSNLIA